MLNSFHIVVDSNCDLPPEYLREHGIEVLAMPFDLDGKAYHSGYWQDISAKEYYAALHKGSIAKTSQIPPGLYTSFFTEYAQQGKDVILLSLSSGLSNSYQSALIALSEVREIYPQCSIYLIDSLNATSGHGLLTMLAVKKRKEGWSAGETAAWLEEKKHSCLGFFTVDDLMYLHRGGRLNKLSAVAGSVLGVKPVLNFAPDGTLSLKEKVRGRKAALEMMITHLKRSLKPHAELDTILITHTDCLEDAQTLAEKVKAHVLVQQVIVMVMGPIIGAHLGPGAVTLVFEADLTRAEYEKRFYA